ncbi:competence-related pilin export protein ComGB [Oceanobacillus limi]|uniref:Competence-related pilin export protein ComGB n=1 Tax=Oceanobacillus limi TaxID=930131 RepID=A0A1H9ZP99_9BACI|nr:competence type IV pilus assembly protein ComGB [Oceanobacillus limi]SES83396.1 competence-related pilin export protein ComGB [Oceanobacillus limi]
MGILQKLLTRSFYRNTIPSELQLRFLHRLTRSLNNGYPLLEALETIKWDHTLHDIADQMMHELKEGVNLDQTFSNAGFHPTISAYLYFSRTNGNLQLNLTKCKEMFAKRIGYLKKFQQTIRYPLILIVIFITLLFFIRSYILPQFFYLFQSNPEALKSIEVTMIIINYLSSLFILTILLTFVMLLFWRYGRKMVSIETQIKLYNAIPIYNRLLRMQTSYLFATHLSSLLKTGLPLKEIFYLLSQQHKLPILSYYASQLVKELTKGIHIVKALEKFTLFEHNLTNIFQRNTDMDALEKDLYHYADLLTDDLHQKVVKLFTYVQPIILIVIGSLIVYIYMSLMWPMFQLLNTV